MMNAKWICPAVTPFLPNGEPDFESAGKLYDDLIAGGINGVLIGGSIGEFFAQTLEQREAMVRFAVKHVNGRMRVIAGTASMIPQEVITFSNTCLEAGADAVMIVPPYYFRYADEDVYRYFARMAEQIHGPVFLYNFPDRTGYTISAEVVKRLAQKYSNIVGIKDTISGMDHTREVIKAVKPIRQEFEVFSGFDDNFEHNVLSGGDGCIAGTSNVIPEVCGAWVKAVNEGNLELSAQYQQKMNRFMDIYGLGSNFVPYIKEACVQIGRIACGEPTFPFPVLNADDRARVRAFLVREGLIK